MVEKHSLLIFASLFSLILLLILLYFQSRKSELLALEAKWLIIAGIPVLLGLLAGGYITKFKGFGIELETLLENPLGEINLIATDVLHGIPGEQKQSLMYLQELSPKKRAEVQRLSFISERRDYEEDTIVKYIEQLPRLEYIEVKKDNSTFVSLLPAKIFMEGDQPNHNNIRAFISALKEGRVKEKFPDEAITDSVKTDDSVVNILPKVRSSRHGLLPVISEKGYLVGIITIQAIEKRIVYEVIAARKRI